MSIGSNAQLRGAIACLGAPVATLRTVSHTAWHCLRVCLAWAHTHPHCVGRRTHVPCPSPSNTHTHFGGGKSGVSTAPRHVRIRRPSLANAAPPCRSSGSTSPSHTCAAQRTSCYMRRRNVRRATSSTPRCNDPADQQGAPCNTSHGACNIQHTAWHVRDAACNAHHATCSIRHKHTA